MEQRPSIHKLRIVQPCDVSWESMRGSDKARFCDHCKKRVYNFSAMDELEIVDCLRTNEEGVCAQIRRSHDGKIVTKSRGRRLRGLQFSLFSLLAVMTAAATFLGFSSYLPFGGQAEPEEVAEGGAVMMGDIEITEELYIDE